MKKFIKKTILFFLTTAIIFAMTGCLDILNKNADTEEENPILAGDTTEQSPLKCMVYFRYEDKNYLVGQQHLVTVPETKRAEEVFLQELIAGPKTTSNVLQPSINPNTRIVSVSDNNGLLFVTLSSHFLTPLSGVPENWVQSEEWTNFVMRQRRLALYSIVNTLTQTGKYSKVQLYIDYNDNEQGERPTRGQMGMLGGNSESLLEPIGRNSQIIFEADTAVMLFMQSFSEKNWAEAAKYVQLDNQEEAKTELIDEFSRQDLTLIEYEVTSMTTAYDGQSSIVTINYFIRSKDGVEYENANMSLKVIRADDIWKISSVSIDQLYNLSNG